MTALDLFLELTAAGCSLSREYSQDVGAQLRVHDPYDVLTGELKEQIRQYKSELLALLPEERPIPLPRYPAPCYRCGGPSRRQGLRYLLCAACQREADKASSQQEARP